MSDDFEDDARKAQQAEIRRLEMADLRVVMSTSAGRRFMWRLLHRQARILSVSHAPNPNDAAFNDGMRNVGLMQLSNIDEACRDLYILMMQEAMDVRQIAEPEEELE